ncbi:peptidase M16 [Longimonas halophila]|uniref:Peptidase M16 n=1 Tax=Longimonas halophila TaxID=1469170 RepID=A0A2H3NJN5_9BACT|nr:insulinase family protein [Longimonas halophila]PEN05787.1 peptidase M16 [Longimonas halophila]
MTQLRIPLWMLALTLACTGLLAAPAAAQAPDDVPVSEYDATELTYPELRDFQVPEPERVELDNGMTILLLQDNELPLVNATARIAGGSVYDPADKVGLASVAGQVMRSGGTESLTPDELNQQLESLGASVETGMGSTSGSAFMSTLSDNVDEVLPLFAEVLRAPRFDQEQVDLAKNQQRSAISRRNDNPQQIAQREFDQVLYGEESPYARTSEYYTIDAIERADLVDFHEQYVHPENIILSVWGDFDAEAMQAQLEDAFADWTPSDDAVTPEPPERTADAGPSVNLIPKDDVNQSTIFIGHGGDITREHPDYPAVLAMNEVLSGGFSGRLFQNVRRDQGLAYSVFGTYSAGYDRPGRFYSGVFTRSGRTVDAAESVLEEIRGMREAPPSQEELDQARDAYLNSFVFNFDSKRQILSRLMTYEYYGYPTDFLQGLVDDMADITPEDVHRVAQEYLRPSDAHIVVLGRESDFERDLTTLADNGTVHTIDISIPTSPPSDEEPAAATEEEQAEGRALLDDVQQALGGETLANASALRIVEETTLQQQGQEVVTESRSTLAADGRFYLEQDLPNGITLTIIDDGETLWLQVPGQGTQEAPPQVRQQFDPQRWRELPYLLARLDHEDLTVQATGSETVDGTELHTVRVTPPVGDPFTLYIDPESNLPQRMDYTAMTQQGPAQLTDLFTDYQEVDGVTMAFTTRTLRDGEEAQSATVQEATVNPDIADDLFSVDTEE